MKANLNLCKNCKNASKRIYFRNRDYKELKCTLDCENRLERQSIVGYIHKDETDLDNNTLFDVPTNCPFYLEHVLF